MRHQTFLFVGASLGILGACTDRLTGPTAATDIAGGWSAAVAPVTEFAGLINFCASTPPEEVNLTPGSTLHLRGATNQNQWVTGIDLVDGPEENVVNGDFNLTTGNGVAHLQVTLTPDDVDGTWVIRQTLRWRVESLSAAAVWDTAQASSAG